MKTLMKNWAKLAGMTGLATLAVMAVYACFSAWGQSLPGLSITLAPSNHVSLTVTNATSTNTQYQIYFTEFLNDPDYPWHLWTNGTPGQTTFLADMGDLESGFFKAVNNTNFAPPVITIIIQSPLNGSVVQ